MSEAHYQIIACDLDETLLSRDCSICERNITAIKKAIDKGVYFVPTTGRGFESVRPVLEPLGLYQKTNQYVISFNGGVITENKNNRIIEMNALPFDTARKLYELGYNKYQLCMHVYTEKEVYVYHPNESEIAFLKNRLPFVPLDKDHIDFLKDRYIVKVLYMYEDYNYLNNIHRELAGDFQNCEISYSSNRYLEFNHKGVDKGKALLKLAQLLGIPKENTMAIGDNINDLAMLRAAGLSVGVANAFSGIRSECDIITDADNNQGGVAEAIERFVL